MSAAASQRWHGEQYPVDAVRFDQHRQVFRRVDLYSVYHAAAQALVIIDEQHRVKRTGGQQQVGKMGAGVAGAVDRDTGNSRLNITP